MLKYEAAIYQGKIDQLTEYSNLLKEHLNKLEEYKNQLGEFWDDEQGADIAKGILNAIKTTASSLSYISLQLAYYKKLVSEYSGASADVQQNIDNMLQSIASVGQVAAMAAGV